MGVGTCWSPRLIEGVGCSNSVGRQAGGRESPVVMGPTLHTPPFTSSIHRDGTSTQLIFLPNAAMPTCPSDGEAGPPQMMLAVLGS